MITLTHPRLFAPLTAARILPSRVGEKAYLSTVKQLLEKTGSTHCNVTGLPLSSDGYGVALEFSKKQASSPNKIRLSDLCAVDEWVFWARHAELAIEEEKGTLIFMPWLNQLELLNITRMLHMGLQMAEEKGWSMMKETATRHLERLEKLGEGSLMINAMGLPDTLESWEPAEWLSAIRDLPMRDRKTYMQRFGQYLRFLPATTGYEEATRAWRSLYQLEGDLQNVLIESEAFFKNVMVKLKKHELEIEKQRNPKVAKSRRSA